MSRSGYDEGYDCDTWDLIRWRGAVASAIRGKRGQAFLRELIEALDALPEPRLIADSLQCSDGVCALGAVALKRRLDTNPIEGQDRDVIAAAFDIAEALAAEVMYENDEVEPYRSRDTPEDRFQRVRKWAVSKLRPETLIGDSA
jgi:hypothetical protein